MNSQQTKSSHFDSGRHAISSQYRRRLWSAPDVIFVSIMLIALLGILAVLYMVVQRRSAGESFEQRSVRLAKQAVLQRLWSPATAEFPAVDGREYRVVRIDREVFVFSHVDSQNAYGAQIRKYWCVVMRQRRDGASFQIIDCLIDLKPMLPPRN